VGVLTLVGGGDGTPVVRAYDVSQAGVAPVAGEE
jgi:hypothetical protein